MNEQHMCDTLWFDFENTLKILESEKIYTKVTHEFTIQSRGNFS